MSLPSRGDLLALCERGFVPEDQWHDRDSASAQRQLGEAYALLRAGCQFERAEMRRGGDDGETHWVRIHSRGFAYFEGDYDGLGPLDDDLFYIPTAERLDRAAGRDWY